MTGLPSDPTLPLVLGCVNRQTCFVCGTRIGDTKDGRRVAGVDHVDLVIITHPFVWADIVEDEDRAYELSRDQAKRWNRDEILIVLSGVSAFSTFSGSLPTVQGCKGDTRTTREGREGREGRVDRESREGDP